MQNNISDSDLTIEQLNEKEDAIDREEELETANEEQEARQWLQDQTPQSGSKPESLYSLFKDVMKSKDNKKLGNLDKKEVGGLSISVIGNEHLADLGNTFGHPVFGAFFKRQSEIITTVSNSKRGWFQELFISQRKTNNRIMSATPNLEPGKSPWSIKNLLPGGANPAPPAPNA